jgi:hypothetical protein
LISTSKLFQPSFEIFFNRYIQKLYLNLFVQNTFFSLSCKKPIPDKTKYETTLAYPKIKNAAIKKELDEMDDPTNTMSGIVYLDI